MSFTAYSHQEQYDLQTACKKNWAECEFSSAFEKILITE